MCAAPPCPDFSQIAHSARGLGGPEGRKFAQWAQLWHALSSSTSFKFALLAENVVPTEPVQRQLDSTLGLTSFLLDASSWEVISRPRVWWSDQLSIPETSTSNPEPVLSGSGRWRRFNRMWQLLPATPQFVRQNATDCPFASFHPEVMSGRTLFPCLTTPAPTEEGRPPPAKRSKRAESPETLARWKAARQQFPPWQYRATALVAEPPGSSDWRTPSADTKEWLHGFPSGYTQGVPEKSRHRMLGNSWHLEAAKFLLYLTLLQTQVLPVGTTCIPPWYPSVTTPMDCKRTMREYY